MTPNRHWMITAGAVVAALAIGFGGARLLDSPASESHEEEEHEEAAGGDFIALSAADAQRAGVSLTTVGRGGGSEIMLPGRVQVMPSAQARVDAPLPGVVVRVHVSPGTAVRAGSPLVTLRSPEGAAARASVDAAAAAADAARAAARRDRSLFERGFVAEQRLEITEAEARRADAELRAAQARLQVWGNPGTGGLVVVRSPSAGVITTLSTAPGAVLHEEDLGVAVVSDTGRVELVFDAPPLASRFIAVGNRLRGETPDGQVVETTVTAIAPAADGGTVTVRASPTGFVPPTGTVISARVITGEGGTGAGLVVPSDAVQTVEGRPSVFVLEANGFRARPVATGASASGQTEILSGLTGRERIAGAGAFLLKAELAKGEAEHGH